MMESFTPPELPDSLGQVLSELAELNASSPADTIAAMRTVRDAANEAAKQVALDGVRQGFLSQRRAAELLHKHPLTISRWLTATEVQAPDES